MTKKRDLIKEIKNYAASNGLSFDMREGGNHSIVRVGGKRTAIPRHKEIPDQLAKKILKQIKKGHN